MRRRKLVSLWFQKDDIIQNTEWHIFLRACHESDIVKSSMSVSIHDAFLLTYFKSECHLTNWQWTFHGIWLQHFNLLSKLGDELIVRMHIYICTCRKPPFRTNNIHNNFYYWQFYGKFSYLWSEIIDQGIDYKLINAYLSQWLDGFWNQFSRRSCDWHIFIILIVFLRRISQVLAHEFLQSTK